MKQDSQVTYVTGDDILEIAIEYLRKICGALEQVEAQDTNERVGMLLDSMTQQERELLDNVERAAQRAEPKVRETYAQYTVELPEEVAPPEAPHSTLSLTQWLFGCNERLVHLFAEQANNTDVEEYKEAFGALSQEVESQSRKLSKEYQRWEDL